MVPLTWKLTALILPSLHTCITSGQLQHHQGLEWGWNTKIFLTKLNGSKCRQVILTRQNILRSGLTPSGTGRESASTGLRKRNLEQFDLGHCVKKALKESGSYSFWSHTTTRTPLLTTENNVMVSTLPASNYLLLHTAPSSLTARCLGAEDCSLPPPPLPCLSFAPNSGSPWGGAGCTPHQVSTSKSPKSPSLHRRQTKCNIISHLSLPRLLPRLPDLWFLFQELCKGAPLINPPSTNKK